MLFLIIQNLLCDGVARPGGVVTVKIHLRLSEHILILLKCALGLQERGLIGTRVDVNQRVALTHTLTLGSNERQ